MAANSDEDIKIRCKLHVLARLKRLHADDGDERDRKVFIEVDNNSVKENQMICFALEENFAKWCTSEPTKHKPLNVNFLLSREEANKS
ncbi:hypothetical protein BOX15_Mlig026135g1, partial [Macrostomum lignano]